MNPKKNTESQETREQRVSRVQCIIYIVMFIGIVLPFLLAWWMGAFRF